MSVLNPNHLFVPNPSAPLSKDVVQLRRFVEGQYIARMARGYAIGTETGTRWCKRLADSAFALLLEARATGRPLVSALEDRRQLSLRFL